MSDPKFKVGEAVMVRCQMSPEINTDFCVINDHELLPMGAKINGRELIFDVHMYRLLIKEVKWIDQCYLHPIPKEESNGIDASEYIKDLIGVTA